ncbi:hypothetical protein [Cellulomonas composti]|uniref:Uncharacterized protein n=1 Tax=Cellulomonas composti TaxID=266130 RepID=A0A511J607_9CELL|nr:hypothetical protein [Cellulomonas composti]GEL93428.1 hypothetical protein CCO02nite_00860 [Cellulomonas composti]
MSVTTTTAHSPRRSRAAITAKVGAGIGAGLLAGLVAGTAARLLMRLVTVAAGEPGEFSALGTAMILVFFGLAVTPGAIARALGARRTAAVLLTLGAGFVAFEAVVTASQDLGSLDLALTAGQWVALVAILAGFVSSFVALALLASGLATRFIGPR